MSYNEAMASWFFVLINNALPSASGDTFIILMWLFITMTIMMMMIYKKRTHRSSVYLVLRVRFASIVIFHFFSLSCDFYLPVVVWLYPSIQSYFFIVTCISLSVYLSESVLNDWLLSSFLRVSLGILIQSKRKTILMTNKKNSSNHMHQLVHRFLSSVSKHIISKLIDIHQELFDFVFISIPLSSSNFSMSCSTSFLFRKRCNCVCRIYTCFHNYTSIIND